LIPCAGFADVGITGPDRVWSLLRATDATQIGEPEPWDGSRFGDGNGGTVEIVDGEIEGDGLNADALPEPRLCGDLAATTREVATDDSGGRITVHLCARHAMELDAKE
jgi:hypothetical protein